MTFESVLNAPKHCPDCNALVNAKDEVCPNCGCSLQKSSLELEAMRYKREAIKFKKKKSTLAKAAFILLTIIFTLVFASAVDKYETAETIPKQDEALDLLIGLGTLSGIFFGLTILCYFKPLTASIVGLIIFLLFMSLCLIGLITDQPSDELISGLIIFFIFTSLFPAAWIKTIYDLTKKQKHTL